MAPKAGSRFLVMFVMSLLASCGNDNPPDNGLGGSSALSWSYVDGGSQFQGLSTGSYVRMVEFNSKLYLTYTEGNHIRVAVYGGTDASPVWTSVTGTVNGIEKDPVNGTAQPSNLIVFNGKLYAVWSESGFTRVAVYHGNDTAPSWSFVDGGGATTAMPGDAAEREEGLRGGAGKRHRSQILPDSGSLWRRPGQRYPTGAAERCRIGWSLEGPQDRCLLLGWRPSHAAVMDLAATPGISARLLPQDKALPTLTQKYGPVYYNAVIPKGTYAGMEADVPVIGVATKLVCMESFDSGLAYQIVKAILEHKPDLVAVHKVAEHLSLQGAVTGSSIPFDPGALKYYAEKGIKVP